MSNDGGGFRWFSGIIATIISGVVVYYLTEGRNPQPPQPNSEPSRISEQTPKQTSQRTPSSPQPEIPLVTSKANYTRLRDLLAQGKWKKADQETTDLLLRGSNRELFLRDEDFKNLSCEDLRTMDRLWVAYSQGKFGFSVQREIYQSLGGTSEYNQDVYNKFGDRVGWRKGWIWLDDFRSRSEPAGEEQELTFDQKANKGHLPNVRSAFGTIDLYRQKLSVLFWSVPCEL